MFNRNADFYFNIIFNYHIITADDSRSGNKTNRTILALYLNLNVLRLMTTLIA